MSESNQVEKSIGEQVADLVQRKPQNYDVLFSVGPEKVKVEAVKIILKAASPVFEGEFDQNWENAVVREGKGIPLPHLDPTAFKLFVNLIILDTWSLDALTNLNLSPNSVLSLVELCRRYKITKAIKNLEKAADDFIQNFDKFKDTTEFLEMSRESLETVFSREIIPLDEKDIFYCICRWAENQCKVKEIEPTGENFREVLGSCFFEIRFPTMKLEDFKKVSVFKKNLFTMEEKVTIYDFIATEDAERGTYDRTQLQFKTNPRNLLGCSVLRLPEQFTTTQNPSFVCDGSEKRASFRVNRKIALHGVGFLGPIVQDTQLDVTVRITGYPNGPSSSRFESVTFKKHIFARKGKIFYFLFDAPIPIELHRGDSTWGNNNYYMYCSLKGTNNVSQFKAANPKHESMEIADVVFDLRDDWNNNPVAELLFKKN